MASQGEQFPTLYHLTARRPLFCFSDVNMTCTGSEIEMWDKRLSQYCIAWSGASMGLSAFGLLLSHIPPTDNFYRVAKLSFSLHFIYNLYYQLLYRKTFRHYLR